MVCLRRLLITLFPVMLVACHGGQKIRPTCELVAISRVEAVLNDPQGFSGEFDQTWPDGNHSEGRMVYVPGKLRLDYQEQGTNDQKNNSQDRENMIVVAKNKRMVAKKFDDQSVTHIGLARNPLGLMLHQPLKLVQPIVVTAIQHNTNTLQISLASADNPSQGLLTLRFLDIDGKLTLKQLQGVDARQHRTIIDIKDVQSGVQVDDSYFTYPDEQSVQLDPSQDKS